MRANNTQINLGDDRHKEYQRQQERLKAMGSTADKVKSVSADIMIENLLKDSFKKQPPTPNHFERQDHHSELPPWILCDSATVPSQYKYFWSLVQSNELADTQKVSQLLLTSGLHVDILGFIWNLANKTIPGQLTKQEFYIVLALVGLAQTGCAFNNLSVLKILPAPSIPVLQVAVNKNQSSQPSTPLDSFQQLQSFPGHQSNNPAIPSQQCTYPLVSNQQCTNPEVPVQQYTNSVFPVQLSSNPAIPVQHLSNPAVPVQHLSNPAIPVQHSFNPAIPDLTSVNENDKQRDHLFTNSAVNETNLFCNNMFDIRKENKETNLMFSSYSGNNDSKVVRKTEPHLTELNKRPYSNFPCIGSSPTAELEDDFSEFQSVSVTKKTEVSEKPHNLSCDSIDDFTEFQSANVEHLDSFETVVITQKRDIPKIPLPKSLSGKLTTLKSNILKISPESERKLKVLNKSESLSSLPESKISSSNKVSTSISVLGSNHGIGSRLANHSLSAKLDRSKHHKHHKIKINSSPPVTLNTDEDIILGVKPTNMENLIPKCCPKKPVDSKTFILKETKIKNDEIPEFPSVNEIGNEAELSGENTRRIEIPMLGTFNETVLPTQIKPQTSGIDLISVQEDKYSALREIELEMNQDKAQKIPEVLEEENDEFGDFLSADIPLPPPVVPENIPTSVQTIDSTPVKNDKDEEWREWSFNIETNSDTAIVNNSEAKSDAMEHFPIKLENAETKSDAVEHVPIKLENSIFDSFSLLNLNESDEKSMLSITPHVQDPPQSDLFNQIQPSSILDASVLSPKNEDLNGLAIFENTLLNEKPKGLSSPSQNLSFQPKTDQLVSNQSDNEFWDFLASDAKPQTGNTLSRHGSLPSLDLKMSPIEETDQEIVWRKCLESCHNLIQEGFDIFNNINIKSVLDEVFTSSKTSDYLNYLNISYQISKRVSQNCSDIPSIQEDLERLWRRLEELCDEYKIKLKSDVDSISEGKFQCNICLGYINQDLINQGAGRYHPSCANLWINFIEETLPYST